MGTSIRDLLQRETPGWKIGQQVPPPPAGYPTTPDAVRANPEKYLGFLADTARNHPDANVRAAATIRFKREYFADQVVDNSNWSSIQKQIDHATYGERVATQTRNAAAEGFVSAIPIAKAGQLAMRGTKYLATGARNVVNARKLAQGAKYVRPFDFSKYVARDPRLQRLITENFRPGGLPGGTLRAARAEEYANRTFEAFKNKDHVEKARQTAKALRNLLFGKPGQNGAKQFKDQLKDGADREYAQRLLAEIEQIIGPVAP